jgi:hippurate hydrolase
MPIVNRVAELHSEVVAWRRDLHAHPELMYDLPRTSAFVAERLRAFGCDEVVTGLGRTGVVAVIRGARPAGAVRGIGLRADMDALPLQEHTGVAYQSTTPGKMHACGHDGHTAMLLGAARYLAETRNFAGEAVLIFQPAEEGGAGAAAMIDDGLLARFPVEQVYGMHNMPGIPVGQFAIRPGAMMASMDQLHITIEGKGAHAAMPHKGIDPLHAGAQLVTALQGIVSRNIDPLQAAVVSICSFHAGHTTNVIPQTAELLGTMRALDPAVRSLLKRRIQEVIDGVAAVTGTRIRLDIPNGYPVLVNHGAQTEQAARVAADIAGRPQVSTDTVPIMGAEDFAFMLEQRPGAFIFVGNGPSADLHHPAYDFNDEAILYGTSYWIRLVETTLAA